MIKETITYTNIDDEEVTEDLYFNLTARDFMDLANTDMGKKMMEQSEGKINMTPEEIMNMLQEMIKRSYGRRVTDADGKNPRFVRNAEKTQEFLDSDVYGELIMQLLSDPSRVEKFLTGLIPKSINKLVEANKAPMDPNKRELSPAEKAYLEQLAKKN